MDLGAERAGREDRTPPAGARVSFITTSTRETHLNNAKKITRPFTQFPPRRDSVGRFRSVDHTTPINFQALPRPASSHFSVAALRFFERGEDCCGSEMGRVRRW
jgi:alkanesulfonate monooxygenase SsuD/methylene tetrahydromethanopterin reductase-like flavin-dependent oxidoreductase (luciferase family)